MSRQQWQHFGNSTVATADPSGETPKSILSVWVPRQHRQHRQHLILSLKKKLLKLGDRPASLGVTDFGVAGVAGVAAVFLVLLDLVFGLTKSAAL